LEKALSKYIGSIVEIIYQGKDGRITKRYIQVRLIKDGIVKAYCLQRKCPRIFKIENILAAAPARKWSV
jgi:predicted DNA-binding transcriptional regulator YafY